jgi:arylsulfatase A-like enzyme
MGRGWGGGDGVGREWPNCVIIFTDDQGYGDVGCYGSAVIRTPRLDRMAREGMRFTSFYSQPVCGPARAGLLTGCYPTRVMRGKWMLPSLEITIAEVLKQAGDATGCIGKGDESDRRDIEGMVPTDQGFDYARDEIPVASPELYDLVADVSERKNVAAEHPVIVARLLKLAEEARTDIGDLDRIGVNARSRPE